MSVPAVVILIAALALGGCQNEANEADDPYVPYERSVEVVGSLIVDYCTYGAVSVKQLRGCLNHVSADDIEVLDTPAAAYALTGQPLVECGRDAGPFCGPGKEQNRALAQALGLR